MIPATGDITIGMVATELGISLPLSLGDSRVRTLAGKPTGPISLGDLRGKSAYIPPTVVCDASVDGFQFASVGVFASASAAPSFQIHGGEAPFTVLWTRVSGSYLVGVQSSNPPIFSASDTTNWSHSAVFRGTVQDARGNSAPFVDVEVYLSAGDSIT